MKRLVFVVLVVTLCVAVATPAMAQGNEGEPPDLLDAISPQLQALLEAILVVVVPWLAYHARRWFMEATAQARQALTAEQYALAELVVRNLVHAVEQMYQDWDGKVKKEYVLGHAQGMLAQYGLDLDLVGIEDLIEGLVHQELKRPIEQARIQPM